MSQQTTEPYVVDEAGTLSITGTVRDHLGAAIPGTSLLTATYTLYDQATDAVINSRSNVDFKAQIDAQGAFVLTLIPADNPITTPGTLVRGGLERHVILVHATYDTNKGFYQEIQVDVRQLNRVP
jgi:hypothetical protein